MSESPIQAWMSWFPGIALILAFFIGSLPFKRIFSRLSRGGRGRRWELDLRRKVELTPASIAASVFDVAKGVLISVLAGPPGLALAGLVAGGGPVEAPGASLAWAAVLAGVIGHCFAPWSRPVGAKGMLPALGGAAVLAPFAALAGLLAFVAGYFSPLREPAWPDGSLDRPRALAALVGLLCACVVLLVFYPIGGHLWSVASIVFIILLRHEAEIDVLIQRHES